MTDALPTLSFRSALPPIVAFTCDCPCQVARLFAVAGRGTVASVRRWSFGMAPRGLSSSFPRCGFMIVYRMCIVFDVMPYNAGFLLGRGQQGLSLPATLQRGFRLGRIITYNHML